MSSPEEKMRHRQRRLKVRSKIAKSLEDKRFHQRKVESKKTDVSKLSHREFVELLNEKSEE